MYFRIHFGCIVIILFYTLCCLVSVTSDDGRMVAGFLFSDLYMRAPFLYCLLLICNASLYAGVYCLVGLAISAMSEKPYSAIIGPFVISMFLHVVFSFAGLPGLSPLSLIMLEYNSNTTALQVYGEVLILAQISILLFSFFGRKNLIK